VPLARAPPTAFSASGPNNPPTRLLSEDPIASVIGLIKSSLVTALAISKRISLKTPTTPSLNVLRVSVPFLMASKNESTPLFKLLFIIPDISLASCKKALR
jgi:hypothetical protein